MTYNGYGGMVTQLGNQTGVLVLQRQKALEESEKELQAIKDSQVGYEEWLKTQNKVVKVKDADAKSTEKLTRFEKILAKVKELEVDFPNAKVIGHNEISEKECPSFDVQKWKGDNL